MNLDQLDLLVMKLEKRMAALEARVAERDAAYERIAEQMKALRVTLRGVRVGGPTNYLAQALADAMDEAFVGKPKEGG